ncbi:hypothetical protein FQA39_LY01503 [Lamprigera yunnana]|nr:hypothetical protein FQA39_LY01503 [Lamprigera yunnana]
MLPSIMSKCIEKCVERRSKVCTGRIPRKPPICFIFENDRVIPPPEVEEAFDTLLEEDFLTNALPTTDYFEVDLINHRNRRHERPPALRLLSGIISNNRRTNNYVKGCHRGKKLSMATEITKEHSSSDSEESDIVQLNDSSDEDVDSLHSQPEDVTLKCIFCGCKFSEEVRRDIWVQS